VYTDPGLGDGNGKIVEVKFISQRPSRYGRIMMVATSPTRSLRASVNTREQQSYQEHLTRSRLRLPVNDRDHLLHTLDGTVGPFMLER
jgi:hypothetical protein